MRSVGIGLITLSCLAGSARAADAPPPDFGPNVLIFDPASKGVQSRVDAVYKTQEAGQFNDKRYALLFKPGKYNADVQVGFYTQVAGLGRMPDDVEIVGAVRSKARWLGNNNATCNFWRCAENLSVRPTIEGDVNVWAVSQATALRRVHVKGNLHLWDGGWSSGGFNADCVVDGYVNSGSQQQWLSRNSEWGEWRGGTWNMVFVGTLNEPKGDWPEKPYTTIDRTPTVREKPYLFTDAGGKFFVRVPAFEPAGRRGITWKTGEAPGESVPIDRFYIARSDRDDAKSINAALAAGKHLLLTPGIYHISEPIRVQRAGTVVLGIGYATLLAENGTVAMTVDTVPGIIVAGILFDAGKTESPTLLQVGTKGAKSPEGDPIVLHDIFCRAGGAAVGVARSFVTIDAGRVVGDNFWLWRADHGAGAAWDANRNANGLIVNGDDVTIYGLFVEHCQEYQTLWNGNGGRVYFYQSEMPYDPPSQDAWSHGGTRAYASYKVAESVTSHEAWGLGVYTVFVAAPVVADSAIEAPELPGVKFHHMVTLRLAGKPGSGIAHILNDKGDPVIEKRMARLK